MSYWLPQLLRKWRSTTRNSNKLKKDNIVVKVDGRFVLSQDGNDLKNELGLADRGYLGNQPSEPSVGRRLDDLLSDLE